MSSVASGYYRPGSSWLHRRNPITKLLGLGWILLAAFLLPPAADAALLIVLGLLAAGTNLLRPLVLSLRIPAVLIASILVVNAFFYPGGTHVVIQFGPFAVSREGLAFGVSSAARLLAAFLASILFLFTTLADDLLEAIVARGGSYRIAFVILSAVQLVPRLQGRANTILEAQQARGLVITGSLATRVRALVPLVGPILLGSLIDVRERTFALEARAFGAKPERTAYRVVVDPPVDRWLRLAILAGVITVIGLAALGVGR